MAGITAFRQAYMHPDGGDETISEWADVEARRLRYDVYRAFADNNAYNDALNRWAKKMKADHGLYQYTRDIYNPTKRIVSFYETHIWGGKLDPLAGDGGALPIITENDNLRLAIAQLWQWSNWRISRNMIPRQGALLGDTFLRVVDDAMRGKVYLERVDPTTVKDVAVDRAGNIKAYAIEYERKDDRSDNKAVFTETAENQGGGIVVYKLYKNGTLYAWDDYATFEWEVPYGFIPMVHIQHQDIGKGWGVSELAACLMKVMEIDDQASKLNDQIRKIVDPFWLLSGVAQPTATPAGTKTAPTAAAPQKGREQDKVLYGPVGADATPLVAPLDIAAVSANIQQIFGALEDDYPELSLKRLRSGDNLSARAIGLVRNDAQTKAEAKRDVYDDGLIRAQQMAVAIGGWRGYDDFTGFGLESYALGDLEHHIGERPVFAQDPISVEETEAAELKNIETATRMGIPIDVYMRERGYSEDYIAAIVNSPEYQARLAMMTMGLDANNG